MNALERGRQYAVGIDHAALRSQQPAPVATLVWLQPGEVDPCVRQDRAAEFQSAGQQRHDLHAEAQHPRLQHRRLLARLGDLDVAHLERYQSSVIERNARGAETCFDRLPCHARDCGLSLGREPVTTESETAYGERQRDEGYEYSRHAEDGQNHQPARAMQTRQPKVPFQLRTGRRIGMEPGHIPPPETYLFVALRHFLNRSPNRFVYMDESRTGIITVARFASAPDRCKDTSMAGSAVGTVAPEFELPKAGGGSLRLSDLRGRPVVLFFYPKDDTSACTAEAIDFSTLRPEFERAGAIVLGISPDSRKKHDKFKAKYELTVDLLSDEDKSTLQAYGVWGEKTLYGRKYMGVIRTTVLVGVDGRIARLWPQVRVAGHAAEVLEAVRSL